MFRARNILKRRCVVQLHPAGASPSLALLCRNALTSSRRSLSGTAENFAAAAFVALILSRYCVLKKCLTVTLPLPCLSAWKKAAHSAWLLSLGPMAFFIWAVWQA